MIDDRLFQRRKGRAARISYFVDEARTLEMGELSEEYEALRGDCSAANEPISGTEPKQSGSSIRHAIRGEAGGTASHERKAEPSYPTA